MNTITDIVDKIQKQILTPLIGLMFAIATVVFLWGVIQYVIGGASNETSLKKGRAVMIWGIVGMFLMASAWGIVKIICNFFGTCS